MLYYHVECPDELSKQQLDDYLARGWYRMQDFIFTTDLIVKEANLLPVFWLRHVVNRYQPTATHKKINKAHQHYTVSVAPLTITDELENLYQAYRQHIDFDISPTLYDCLYEDTANTIYHTQCLSIRKEGQLIAAGIFDEGENSIAGILNFYHPEYKQQSPGKHLMLQKMQWAALHQKQYYYTGYISTGFSKFDYKTMFGISCTEVYNRKGNIWLPWQPNSNQQMEKWLLEEKRDMLLSDDTE
jgi:leucyl-tRNA---protein transferase